MDNLFSPVGILHRQVEGCRVDGGRIHAPAFGRVGVSLLQFDKLGKIGVVKRVGLAHVAARFELVIPGLAGRCAFLEEQHYGFDARALKGAAGAVEDGIQVATFQQQFPQTDRRVIGVGQEGVLDDHAAASAGLEHLDEMLEEQERGFAGADREVLLHFLALLAAERRLGQHDVVAVLVLNVGEVFGQGVGVDDVRRFYAVQDHVHDRDHISQRLLFLAVESAGLQDVVVAGGEIALGRQVVERLAQEARRTDRAVINALADFGLHHLHDSANQRTRRVILAAVAPGVAHVLDLGFVKVRQFVLFGLRAKAEFVDVVDDFAQVVAAVDLVLDLAEYLADLVFDGVRAIGFLLEAVQVGKQLAVYEVAQIVAGRRLVVIRLAVVVFGRGPAFPAVRQVENERVFPALQLGFHGLVLLQAVQKFQEQQPRGLLGVIQFAGATGLFVQNVVDIFEGLFEHGFFSFEPLSALADNGLYRG